MGKCRYVIGIKWLLAVVLFGAAVQANAQAQQCLYPAWTAVTYNTIWTSSISAVDVGTRALFPGYNPATHPGVTLTQPASCPITGGDELAGTATYLCSENYTCDQPTCTSYQTGTTSTTVWESCDTPFWVRVQPPALSETCSKNCVGDPINPSMGNVYKTEDDIVVAGISGGPAWRRYYNSADGAAGNLGAGWRHSYSRSVSTVYQATPLLAYPGAGSASPKYSDPATACVSGFAAIKFQVTAWQSATTAYNDSTCVISTASGMIGTLQVYSTIAVPTQPTSIEFDVTRDDGQVIRFPVIGGTISTLPGGDLRLQQSAGGFTVTDGADTTETYDLDGRLLSTTSRSGVTLTLNYDASFRLSVVTDTFGHSLTLSYDAQNRLSTVADPASQVVQYSFDATGRLSTITNADSTGRTFVYENAVFPFALTGVFDESTLRYSTWGYDAQGRGVSTQEAGGANATTLLYNSGGTVTATDALGAVRTFTYDRVGDRKLAVGISGSQCPTCADGKSTGYDFAGFVSKRIDYNGNVTCYANDPSRGLELVRVEGFASGSVCPANLAAYTPAAGTRQRRISTAWHPTYRMPTQVVESNRTTAYTHDASGNALTRTVTDTTVTPNVSRTWTYTYTNYGQVLTEDGPRSDVSDLTTYTYYSCTTGYQCGQLNAVTNAAGQLTTYNVYNAHGQVTQLTDPNNVFTTLAYDLRQRLTDRCVGGTLPTCSGGEKTTYEYWPTGLLKKVTLPDASFVSYTYDAAHRLTAITDGLGNHINYTLDAMGNRTATATYDPLNVLSTASSKVYNTLGQLSQQIGAAGTAAVTTAFGYDNNGNQTTINAPLSRNTTNQYDELNRLKQVTDPATGITLFGYDANDNLASVTDPLTKVTSYTYTGFGDLKTQTSPATGVTTNTYDSGGNLATSTDARNVVSSYSYDALNRVSSVAYTLGASTDQTIFYGYDVGANGKGRLTSASDANHGMGWQYDALGRVTSKSQTVGGIAESVGYGYSNGQLATLTTPSGQSVAYSYVNNQVSGISVNGTTLLSGVVYEPFGPARTWTWGNASTEIRLHDTDGNPSQISHVESTSYTLDNAFRITGVNNASNPSASWTYGYDNLDRITSANAASNISWTYDANGNRQTQGGAAAPAYAASNITLAYNNRGRMSSATASGTTSYIYNALGQRVSKNGPGGAVVFAYDEAGHLIGEYTGDGALIQETIWLGDTPVATLRPGSPVLVYYIHADHLNTPKIVSRPSDSAVMWRWDQDPFGTAQPNSDPQGQGAFNFNLRFPGQYYDSETGLSQNYFRDLDPQTGRYVESDPIGLDGGINTYVYVDSDPIVLTDPDGLQIRPPMPVPRLPRRVEEHNRATDPMRQLRREGTDSDDQPLVYRPPRLQCIMTCPQDICLAPGNSTYGVPAPGQPGCYLKCGMGPFASPLEQSSILQTKDVRPKQRTATRSDYIYLLRQIFGGKK
jgi:RHS repeat-associated protein